MKLHSVYSLYIFACGVSAASFRRQNGTSWNSTGSPCAMVSSSAFAAVAATPGVMPVVDAQLGYDCLTSVPLNASAATALVEAILPFIEWQTDVSYLKNPPSGYLEPAVDVWGSLNAILTNIGSGTYANEYEFQADLFRTFNLAKDGHFRFFPDLLTKALEFGRTVGLVSVSLDGVEVPKVYTRDDIEMYNSANGTVTPSALSQINGQDAVEFLTNWGQLGALQDPDALYNNVFYEKAFEAQTENNWNGYFAGSGRFGYIYPGANTTITFENGTTNTYNNYAGVIGDFTGVTDGESFYQVFCTGPHVAAIPSNVTYPTPTPPPLPPTATTTAAGYPTPVVISSDQQVSGYFLDDDPAYADVAVLSMVSFEPDFPIEFQSVVQTLISDAKAAGKTKLVVDLSGNGGGVILVGYDTFRQLFPQIVQDGYSRFREHEAFNMMSAHISAYDSNLSAATDGYEQIFAYENVLDYRYDLNLTDQNFATYEDKFAPHVYNGDNFTNILRWNLSDPLTTLNTTTGVGENITGYGDRQNFTQPFAAEDIIMVYDGYCASTCTLFSEFMRLQGGVKSIAFGGRPTSDTIQAIGGVKGANNYPFSYIYELASLVLETATPEQIENLTAVSAYSELPQNRSTDNSLNVRDNILPGNLEDGVPAQYVYEAADCRLFYEPGMISDVRAIWKKAADAAWGDAKCVAGGLSQSNQTSVERKRRSEEMKLRARSEANVLIGNGGLRSTKLTRPLSPEHGRKVPT